MFKTKSRIIVGMTTYYNEYLGISVPGLAHIDTRFTLVIHNDNPDTRVTRRHIRKLGYHGKLHIINTKHNVGLLRARLAILEYIRKQKITSDWIVFVDDDDILTNLNLPDVSDNNFAIIQNMPIIRTRLIDVLRVAKNPANYTVDNENICMVRPHVGMAGTLVRLPIAMRMYDVLCECIESISDIDETLSFRPPVDMTMWSALNIIARHDNERATPIYMDTVNYIATDIDTAQTKYGMKIQPGHNPEQQIRRAIMKYDNVVRSALAAAPLGHDLDA